MHITASDLLSGIAGSVSGAILMALAIYGYGYVKRVWSERALRRFWSFLHSKVVVTYPLYHGPTGEAIPNVARIEDLLAMDLIVDTLKRLGVRAQMLEDLQDIPENADAVLVCSPKGNRHSAALADKIQIPFKIPKTIVQEQLPHILEVDTGVEFVPPCDRGGEKVDFALLARLTDSNPRRRIFLVWGVHGAGTLGAAKFSVSNRRLKELGGQVSKSSFALLLRVPFSSAREVGEAQIETFPRDIGK